MIPDEHIDESLIDRQVDAALEGDDTGDESLALTAAAVALALGTAGKIEPLPDSLRGKLETDAGRHFASPLFVATQPRPTAKAWRYVAAAGWLSAAASWFLVATLIRPTPNSLDKPDVRVEPVGWTAPLKASDHPLARNARGELVWNQASQKGTLRLNGLAGLDPKNGIYQLWIFDAKRDPRYPIDGGTFLVSNSSTITVVPVRATLPVSEPTLFAITLEPPGGVVVSDRQRIMLTASYP